MKLFLDTADLDAIRRIKRLGMLDGVTTNPSHVSKTGLDPQELYPLICGEVDGPVSLETVGTDADQIFKEGLALAAVADNVVVKVPLLPEGLIAVRRLAGEGIATNVTVTFSANQAILAAKAGADYVSPFVGRLDGVGHDGMDLVRQIHQIYDNYDFKTQIITAAVRHPIHVLQAALAGSHICTMAPAVFDQLYEHPLTDSGIAQFLADWRKVPNQHPETAGVPAPM
ncbi:MAG: fructose-6-phosphate aldolase [Phycisphaeraceae bacterium]|nr:fructose-6-phosphate aldolase [Phycisphaeraceae bacterium]